MNNMQHNQNIERSINDTITTVLKRLVDLDPEDRFYLLMEHIEWITSTIEVESELSVSQLHKEIG